MSEAVPYLAVLANAVILSAIALMLRSLGRMSGAAVEPPIEYKVAAFQQPTEAPIVLNIDDLGWCDLSDRPTTTGPSAAEVEAPAARPVAARRHHHH